MNTRSHVGFALSMTLFASMVQAPIGRADVTGVPMAVVDHFELIGFERRAQALRQAVESRLCHGSTLMNGRTS